jgi:SAM-dependent methyltransferase
VISPLVLYAEALRGGLEEMPLARSADGSVRPARLDRWLGPADDADERALEGLAGPVLDLGCGPGRHLHALARRGVFALGVDISPVAVGLARDGGADAIVASVFDELPGAGSWSSALLLDGNIGIGGHPERLLSRVRTLLAPRGRVVLELDAPHRPTIRTQMRLENRGAASAWFDWAEVSVRDADRVAESAGLRVSHRWRQDQRWFVVAKAPPEAAG